MTDTKDGFENDVRGYLRSLRPAHSSGVQDNRLNKAISMVLAAMDRRALASETSDD